MKETAMYYSNLPEVRREQRRQTILIIDDSRDIRYILNKMLKSNYQVLSVDNVDAALNILSDIRPDLVITDYDLPGKNGLEGLREIRELHPHIRVIMLTGSATEELTHEAIEQGVEECLAKPYDLPHIRECIQSRLSA
jgi:DNA-binding NtrC family response regulator